MKHGWVSRGDGNDAGINEAVRDALRLFGDFIDKRFE